jgi:hypothetical protein
MPAQWFDLLGAQAHPLIIVTDCLLKPKARYLLGVVEDDKLA